MFPDLNIESWLKQHCLNWRQEGREMVFEHESGETSVLLLRALSDSNLLHPRSASLQPFYEHYVGASIGNSQLIIASSIEGGITISQGYTLPDLLMMQDTFSRLGINFEGNDEPFMAEAAWMFAYGCRESGESSVLLKYDRDFDTSRIISGVGYVLNAWWQMVQNR